MPNQITQAQERAIQFHKGACLTIAAPGSGKTFVITNRVVRMVSELHIPSQQILVITFTKTAAKEMEERFHQLLPEEAPWFGTFHSCFYYILKNSYTNIPNRFISTEEKTRILRDICEENLSEEQDVSVDNMIRTLGLFMNNGLTMPKDLEQGACSKEQLRAIYNSYHKALVELEYMDFDDLQLVCYQLLKNHLEIRKRFQEQFQYILIDECQDMNLIQYEIIKLLAGTEQNVFMVGDDDQSVYRFRGSKVELMERFLKEYRAVTKITLDTNFRSTAGIVDASMKVISRNKKRFSKKIQAQNLSAAGVEIAGFPLRKNMYDGVLERLLQADTAELSKSAVIYRTNQELRGMAYKLRQKGIPYFSKEDQKSMFDEEWYLDIEAYFKLALGSLDRQYVLRIANKPNRFIRREQLVNITKLPDILGTAVKHIKTLRPYLAIKYVWSGIGYGRWLERECDLDIEKWDIIKEQLDEITEEMKGFATIEQWLVHVEEDRERQKANQKKKPKEYTEGIHLLTMHAAKGLEFDSVYLLDVNKGKVPKGSKLSIEEMEEERRLFYVAMTRAKFQLHIYYVRGMKGHELQPSVFLEPIL